MTTSPQSGSSGYQFSKF
uniref:Uncharacterized protein n=1 Tax=Anguilla anguilla TaxID=7936 RepID=A0A0E9QML3_ANGAN